MTSHQDADHAQSIAKRSSVSSSAKLELANIVKHYGDVEAVRGISFSVYDGEFVTIVGPSGCGKSSTLRMITGLEEITDGDLFIAGERVNELPARERNIALAFENYALYPHLSIAENIAFPLRVRKTPSATVRQRIAEVLAMLHLEEVQDKRPFEVAGGQQQRTSLGRALIREAAIYLIDEPLSHLDAQERASLRAEIRRIQKTQHLTCIMVTHDQAEALAMSDRIIIMNAGKIMQIGTPAEAYEKPQNLFVADFIGEPPMNLLEGTMTQDTSVGKWLWRKDGISLDLSQVVFDMSTLQGDTPTVLGIRPSYVQVGASPSGGNPTLSGCVFSYEFLGDTSLLTAQFNGDVLVRALCPPTATYTRKQPIHLSLQFEHILLFDKNTEQAFDLADGR